MVIQNSVKQPEMADGGKEQVNIALSFHFYPSAASQGSLHSMRGNTSNEMNGTSQTGNSNGTDEDPKQIDNEDDTPLDIKPGKKGMNDSTIPAKEAKIST